MPASKDIHIYAELLSNIRQVSVGCTLPTPAADHTRAYIAPDGRALTVDHGGQNRTIQLPGSVAFASKLPVDRSRGRRLAWRLPLAAPQTGRILPLTEHPVPWSATDLEPGSAVVCRNCKSTIINAGTLRVWKDLPSENWAEMMEFWHCHKPTNHQHDHADEHLTKRGYGASSRIAAQSSVGFVDLTSFLFAYSDVIEPSVSTSSDTDKTPKGIPLKCATCKTQLGVYSEQASSVSMFKWQVHVKQQDQSTPESSSPSLVQCVSAMLLATMARSGCSKSILIPMETKSKDATTTQARELLNIWVFNANITFSSTEASALPVNAVKVFYRTVSQEAANKMLDSVVSDVEDISLPAEAIATIVELLNKSTSFVPESDRKFQEWTVGLLEKWDDRR